MEANNKLIVCCGLYYPEHDIESPYPINELTKYDLRFDSYDISVENRADVYTKVLYNNMVSEHIIVLPHADYDVTSIECQIAPSSSVEDKKRSIIWSLKEYIDAPISSITVDSIPIQNNVIDAPPKSFLTFFTKNSCIDSYVLPFQNNMMQTPVLDVQETSLRNIVNHVVSGDDGNKNCYGIIDYIDGKILFYVVLAGNIVYMRKINHILNPGTMDNLVNSLVQSTDGFDRQYKVAISSIYVVSDELVKYIDEIYNGVYIKTINLFDSNQYKALVGQDSALEICKTVDNRCLAIMCGAFIRGSIHEI